MRLAGRIEGALRAQLGEEAAIIAKAGTIAVRAAAAGARRDLVKQAERAFSKRRSDHLGTFANLVRFRADPARGYALSAEAHAYSRATYGPKAGGRRQFTDLLDVFDRGEVIEADGATWLAVPTRATPRAAGRGNSERPARPADFKYGKAAAVPTVFIRISSTRALIVARRTRVVLWVLVKKVILAKRLNVDAVYQRRLAKMEQRFARELGKEDARLAKKRGSA